MDDEYSYYENNHSIIEYFPENEDYITIDCPISYNISVPFEECKKCEYFYFAVKVKDKLHVLCDKKLDIETKAKQRIDEFEYD